MTEQVDVGVIMGSQSDWPTMKHAAEILEQLKFHMPAKSCRRIARPTGWWICQNARARGLKVIIAGAGGAAHCRAWLRP